MIGTGLEVALGLALFVVAAGVAASETAEVEVLLDIRGQRQGALPEEVVVYAADPATREPLTSHAVAPVSGGRRVLLALPARREGWLLWARTAGWWGPVRHVEAERSAASLVLVPRGVVRFALHGVDRAVDRFRPGDVWIVGRVDGGDSGLKQGVYGGPCAVDREPSRREVLIVCPFAVGARADVRVGLGPFLPVLRSDVTVAVDTDLGPVEPVRGAAVTGHLASVDGSSRVFRLRQRRAPRAFSWSAWTDSSGVFRFEGLSPGTYELRLSGAAESWPVRLESLSESLDLGRLSSATGNVLAMTFMAPLGIEVDRLRPVVQRVQPGIGDEVESRGGRHEPDARSADGAFVWRGLPAGDYRVDVFDDRGGRWRREALRFHGGRDHHYVELDAVALEGRIERGGAPLEGVMVWFGGLRGAERVSFRSGEQGRFGGLLPREGHWPVEVTPLPVCDPCEGGWDTDGLEGFDGQAVDDAGSVEVLADVDGVARVSIDLPDGSVSGRVSWRRADTGVVEPVEGASVSVLSVSPFLGDDDDLLPPIQWRRVTDAMGRFEIGGLPDGDYVVWADAWLEERRVRSREDRFRLASGDSIDRLEIRLEHGTRLTVAVRSGGAPVAGAQTFVRVPGNDRNWHSEVARTARGRRSTGCGKRPRRSTWWFAQRASAWSGGGSTCVTERRR